MYRLLAVVLISGWGGGSLASKWQTPFYGSDDSLLAETMCDPKFANRVYCGGKLIEAVNWHSLYNDSKDFVDSPLKTSPDEIIAEFDRRFPQKIEDINAEKLLAFVKEYFEEPTSELINCEPPDWKPEPPRIMRIRDPILRQWALQLHAIWRTLCRRIDDNIGNKERHSILYVDNHFIIPGGRFREFYYWDSYWIVKGLLVSGMRDTAKAMTRNLAQMVKKFGFIPNGGRIYYTRRSQPPMFIPTVYEIYEDDGDLQFLKEMMPSMKAEFDFWEQSRRFQISKEDKRRVYFYKAPTKSPRPESLKADLEMSRNMNKTEREFFFQSTASAAESGWDFSSRWFADRRTMETIETVNIAPVDLNSFMCYNMEILTYLNEVLEDGKTANKYRAMHTEFRLLHEQIFYNKTMGIWYDYHVAKKGHILHNYASVGTPLFTECYSRVDESKPRRFFDALYVSFPPDFGGVSRKRVSSISPEAFPRVSLRIQINSGEWNQIYYFFGDFPNGWSPTNHMIIEGLRKSGDRKSQDQAVQIARKWIHGNFRVFNQTKQMYEKYNVIESAPEPGGGGEYNVQIGFGWSNGVILDLLDTYYDRMDLPPSERNGGGVFVLPIFSLCFMNILLTLWVK